MAFELTKELYEVFIEAIEEQNDDFLRKETEELYPADISSILYELNTEQAKYVINLLDLEVASEIISDLDEDICTRFLENFEAQQIAQWINYIDSDDAADILMEMSSEKREVIIEFVEDNEKAEYILDLLHYDENSAGGLMAKELISANLNWNVVQCIEEIRRQAEKVQKIYSVYVIDDEQVLRGRVSLKKIILSNDNTRIADIYEEDLIHIKTYRSSEEVADVMQKYDLEAIPVVNPRRQLVGRITIDDIVDVITEKAELDRQIMSGLTEDIEESDTVWTLLRARLPWLIIGIFGGLLGAQFIGLFEEDLLAIPAMAFFIPLITATGGNVGIQSSSIILQSLANKSFKDENYAQRMLKVFLVAALNGIVIAILVMLASWAYIHDFKLSLIVAIALFFVVMLASFMGTVTPLVLHKFNLNPALAAGPFITTANDLLGLAVYFTTAHLLYTL